jgi:hypothetical protein
MTSCDNPLKRRVGKNVRKFDARCLYVAMNASEKASSKVKAMIKDMVRTRIGCGKSWYGAELRLWLN